MTPPTVPTPPTRFPRWITQPWPRTRTVVVIGILAVLTGSVIGVWWFSTVSTLLAWFALAVSAGALLVALLRVLAVAGGRSIPFNSLLLAALSASGVTFGVAGQWSRGVGSGTPAPPFPIGDPSQVDGPQRARLLAHAESLTFDTVTHRAWDERILIDKDSSGSNVIGPRAKISPEQAAYLNSQADLRQRGRIVARVWVDPAYRAPRRGDTTGYGPLKLPPGVSYVWIDSLRVTGKGMGRARALIIPADPREPIRADSVRYTFRRRVWETYSRALWRWSFAIDPECFNVTCPWGCCENCWNPE